MKIRVEKYNINYYDEMLFAATYYKKIKTIPNTKINRLSKHFNKSLIIIGTYLLLLIICYIFFDLKSIYLSLLLIFLFLFIITIRNKKAVMKRLEEYKNDFSKSTFEINEDGVILDKENNQTIKVYWDCIDKIIINKYSILFIPKSINFIMTGIDKEYEKYVLEFVKKYGKENLIIDNSSLYK